MVTHAELEMNKPHEVVYQLTTGEFLVFVKTVGGLFEFDMYPIDERGRTKPLQTKRLTKDDLPHIVMTERQRPDLFKQEKRRVGSPRRN